MLPADLGGPLPPSDTPSATSEPPLPETLPLLALTEAYQRRVVRAALERARWNRNEAAATLGVSRQWLHRLLSRWGGEP